MYKTLEQFGLAVYRQDRGETASNSTAPVDLGRLNEITDGDPEFTHELASTFIHSGEQVLSEIREALDSLDRGALSRAAHKLKGASANIHAETLRELAFSLETQAASVDQARLRELVRELQEGFHAAAAFLREQAPPPPAKTG